MNRRDDQITRLQESAALHRVSRQGLSTPARGIGAKKRDSRADLFAKLAEQFVDQVKALARSDDDDDCIIDLEVAPSIKQEPAQTSKETFESGDIPSQAANRVLEVLEKEFGISAQEPARLQRAGRSRSLNASKHRSQRASQSFNIEDGELTPSTSAAASRDRSNEVEIREIKPESITQPNHLENRQAQTAENAPQPSSNFDDQFFNRFADKLAESITSVLATKILKTSESNANCTSSSTANHQVQASTSTKSPDQEAIRPSTSTASSARDSRQSQSKSKKRTAQEAYAEDEEDSTDDESEPADSSSSADSADSNSDPTLLSSRPSRDTGDSAVKVRDRVKRLRVLQPTEHSGHSEAEAVASSVQTSNSLSGDDLWDEKIEMIYRKSKSFTHFARNLLQRFFDVHELIECDSVYGHDGLDESGISKRPLDPKRVNMIRQLVQLKAGTSRKKWTKCVESMNAMITKVKLMGSERDRFVEKDKRGQEYNVDFLARVDNPSEEKEDDDNVGLVDSKTSVSISNRESLALLGLRDIPDRALSRIAEVLQTEFCISAEEHATLQRVGRSRSLNGSMHRNQGASQSFNIVYGELTPSTSVAASRDRSNEVEMREINDESIAQRNETADNAARPSNNFDDQLDLFASEPTDVMKNDDIRSISEAKSKSRKKSDSRLDLLTSDVSLLNESTHAIQTRSSYLWRNRTAISSSKGSNSTVDNLEPSRRDQACSSSSAGSANSKSNATKSSSRIHQQPSLVTKHRASMAQKLAKRARARLSLGSSSLRHLDPSHAAESSGQASSQSDVFWDQTIQKIYEDSDSIRVFSKNLMKHFFDESELIECYNVYGRVHSGFEESNATRRHLDPKRINMIRQLVQMKVQLCNKLWSRCVDSMNSHIARLKQAKSKPNRLAKIDKREHFKGTKLFPKQKPSLKMSTAYKENSLSYKEINGVYLKSSSMSNFAKNLMLHLFTKAELRECYNVYGRGQGNKIATERSLDATRVELIRRIVTENCTHHNDLLWKGCTADMNSEVIKVKRE